MKKVVFLYSELAGYLFACFKELSSRGVEISVFHWPVNPEAPFIIPSIEGVRFISRTSLSNKDLSEEVLALNADAILVSGWLDKGYLQIAERARSHTRTVILFDTQWSGSLKQRLMSVFSKGFLARRFSHAWVAGPRQKEYALRLGFHEEHVFTGFYTADIAIFNDVYARRNNVISKEYPKTLIYVGRYVEQKNVSMLWSAFLKANEMNSGTWRLTCIGTGELFEERLEHPSIEHIGFVQPEDMKGYLADAGVFVLPSTFEPWGVVVHEMAAAGLPLLLSNQIGASVEFLEEGRNGYRFDSSSESELIAALNAFMQLDESTLRSFSQRSHELAQRLDPRTWTDRLLGLL